MSVSVSKNSKSQLIMSVLIYLDYQDLTLKVVTVVSQAQPRIQKYQEIASFCQIGNRKLLGGMRLGWLGRTRRVELLPGWCLYFRVSGGAGGGRGTCQTH